MARWRLTGIPLRNRVSSSASLVRAAAISFSSSDFESCRRATASASLPSEEPPRPKKIPFTVSAHGRKWQDHYHWMSNTGDPDLVDYLRRENLYADAFMADADDLRRKLVSEMRSRMPPRMSAHPERWGPWLYYQYIPEGREYPVLCRRREGNSSFSNLFPTFLESFTEERTLLDWNVLAEQFGYVHVGTCRVSPDHKFLAYTVDPSGGEIFKLQVKDLQTGEVTEKSEANGVFSLAWAVKSDRLFYTTCDETLRPVLCMRLKSMKEDELLFTENDSACCVDITCTKDGRYITINSNSRTSSEVYIIDSMNERNELVPVQKRMPGVRYFLEHHHGFFYILTNSPPNQKLYGSEGYHLMRCRTEALPLRNYQDFIIPEQGLILQDMDIFDGHLVLFVKNGNHSKFCSIDFPIEVYPEEPFQIKDLKPWFFPFPPSLCSIVPALNQDFMAHVYRVVISSPVVPEMIIDYNMAKKTFSVIYQEEVLDLSEAYKNSIHLNVNDGSMNLDNRKHLETIETNQKWRDLSDKFHCERTEVASHDGVKVPLTILYSRKSWHNRKSPGLLHGYGSYGEALDKSWCTHRISLLDRGWVLAFADVRGGEGPDPSWHEAGRGIHKLNSIRDFAACGVHLVGEGYINKSLLCATGHSAGSLLVAATINLYPDLFCAAILKVPFLDVCHTMLDPTLPLTSLDYEEFGNPEIEDEFELMRSYSPYDNIHPGACYPPMFITASFHDSRVGVWEAGKWVAKARDGICPDCSRKIILRTNMSGGHFGEGGRFTECEETALDYAFLIKAIGGAL